MNTARAQRVPTIATSEEWLLKTVARGKKSNTSEASALNRKARPVCWSLLSPSRFVCVDILPPMQSKRQCAIRPSGLFPRLSTSSLAYITRYRAKSLCLLRNHDNCQNKYLTGMTYQNGVCSLHSRRDNEPFSDARTLRAALSNTLGVRKAFMRKK